MAHGIVPILNNWFKTKHKIIFKLFAIYELIFLTFLKGKLNIYFVKYWLRYIFNFAQSHRVRSNVYHSQKRTYNSVIHTVQNPTNSFKKHINLNQGFYCLLEIRKLPKFLLYFKFSSSCTQSKQQSRRNRNKLISCGGTSTVNCFLLI